MSQENEAPVVEEPIETDDEFNAGFSDQAAPTETPAEPEPETTPEAPPAAEPEPEPEPELATLTKAQLDDLLQKANRIDEINGKLEKQFGTAFGKIGGIERVLQQLQSSGVAGGKVEITDEIVADLTAEFPEMGALVKRSLEKLVEKLPTHGGAAPAIDPSEFAKVEERAVTRARQMITEETLDDTHAGWREVIGLPNAEGKIPETEFRKWLANQPEDYRNRVNKSFSAVTIGKAIDDFQETTKKAAAQAEARRARTAAGVTPRGTGGHQPAPSDDDEFNAGFRGG